MIPGDVTFVRPEGPTHILYTEPRPDGLVWEFRLDLNPDQDFGFVVRSLRALAEALEEEGRF